MQKYFQEKSGLDSFIVLILYKFGEWLNEQLNAENP